MTALPWGKLRAAERSPRPLWRRLALVLVLLLLAYGLYRAWQVQQHLTSLRQHAAALRAADVDDLGPLLADLRRDLASLRQDLPLTLAMAPYLGRLPRIGPTIQAGPILLAAGERYLAAADAVWAIVGEPVKASRSAGHGLEGTLSAVSAQIERNAVSLEATALDVRETGALVSALPSARLLPQLSGPVAQLQSVVPLVTSAMDGLLMLPRFTGERGYQAYLLLAQNNDELRPTGGFISSLGVLSISNGMPQPVALQDSYQVEDWGKPHPDPPEPLRKYMHIDLLATRDANWWPDFPTSASAVADLYHLNGGRAVSGVVAIDLVAASRLVDVLAPLTLADGTRLKAGQSLDVLRSSWGLPAGSLQTPGIVITATRPFTEVEITLTYDRKKGQVWFDSVVLEDVRRPGVNLVRNGSFEDTDAGGGPDAWQAEGLVGADGVTAAYAHSGQRSLWVVGDPAADKAVEQRIALAGKAGTRLRLSAQSRADGTNPEGGPYALTVRLLSAQDPPETVVAAFPVMTHDWASAGSADILGDWWVHRKDFVEQAAQAVLQKLLTKGDEVPWLALLMATKDLLDQRHVQVWPFDPALQALVERCGWTGALRQTAGDYLLVVDSNVGYNKVSSSISETLHYAVALEPAARARAQLRLHYRHNGLAAGVECDKFKQYVPVYEQLMQGCYWDYVRVYVPLGTELLSASGLDEPVEVYTELGYTVLATAFLMRPGEERSLSLEYLLPERVVRDDMYTLTIQKQAGTEATPLSVAITSPRGLQALSPGLSPEEVTATRATFSIDLLLDRYLAVALRR